MIFQKKYNNLLVNVYDTRDQMGKAAAKEATAYIVKELNHKQFLNIVFAAAPSQNDFLKYLAEEKQIDWSRINAFHMDEYIGLHKDAPQEFGNFLKEAIFGKVPFNKVYYLRESMEHGADKACAYYTALLEKHPIDVAFLGIGENGHIAFNDPHVAFFNDKYLVKIVDLDQVCRIQQVNDGCFKSLDDVPTHAITLTIPALMSAKRLFCIVPTSLKANALKNAVLGDITEDCPASIIRTHESATLYCDKESAQLIH